MTEKLPNLAWIFDDTPIPDPEGKGEAAVKFIKALRHPKSRLPGNAFALDPWQERIVRRLYGDTLPDGERRIQEIFLMVGRGNRKTSLIAACLMLHLVGPERVPLSSICSIANARDQAALTFKEMAGICRATPRINEAVQIQDTEKRITYRKHSVVYEALSSDAKTAHGRSDVVVFWDEGHAEKKFDLIEAAETTINKGRNTLFISASTAGIGQTGPFYAKYDHARKIVDGRIEDETFLPILFEAPADVDYHDLEWLHATNPGLPYGYPNLKKIKRYIERCQHSPADRQSLLRLHFSVWLDGAANPEWDLSIWDEGHGEIDLEALRGRPMWIGVDLSKRIDLSAVACVIDMGDAANGEQRFALHVMAFSPEAQLRKREAEDSAPYTQWRDEGWLIATEGDIVDYGTVEAFIRDASDGFDLREVVFDVALAREMMESLERDGYPVAAFPQTLMNFAKPVDTFEDMFLNRRLVHNSPCLRWAVGNTVMMRDQNDNRRPAKNKSADRIDPCVAAIMAVSRAAQGATGRSSYDDAPDDFISYI